MSNWYAFRILCNGNCIASFMTRQQAEKFCAERAAKWPQNIYAIFA